jgi:hypothetical protein
VVIKKNYQQMTKQTPEKERHRPGDSARPQQKHLLAAMARAWPARSSESAPTPYQVEASVL